MRRFKAKHCDTHIHNTLPCLACQRLSALYRAPELEQKRVRAVVAFCHEHTGIEDIPEGRAVFSRPGVTDWEISEAKRRLTEYVCALAPYPDYYPNKRRLAAKARDFLETLLENTN